MPLSRLLIVENQEIKAAEIKGAFAVAKQRYLGSASAGMAHRYDFFISYSHENMPEMDFLVEQLRRQDPHLKIFRDRDVFKPGCPWNQELFDAIETCARVIPVYSPAYLSSPMCKEEFSVAHLRQIKTAQRLLVPIFLCNVDLPYRMQNVQYIDCREGDRAKLAAAVPQLLSNSPL